MVPAKFLGSGSGQVKSEHRPSGEPVGGSGVGIEGTAAGRRTRARIGELDRAICRTRLSQRQFLIQLLADSARDSGGDSVRVRGSAMNNQWSGKVVDWD